MTTAQNPASRNTALLLGLCLAVPLLGGCKGKGLSLSKAVAQDEKFAHVPVPPPGGPKLFALLPRTPVYDRPSTESRRVGELQVGASVVRSKEPYTKANCDGGWYAVRPRGFVCAGPSATLDGTVVMRGLPPPPDLTHALPYRYARARSESVPLYSRAPSAADQVANEPDLKKVLSKGIDKDPLGAGANDVPLDPRGAPTGPPVLLPTGEGIVEGRRTVASFFTFGAEAASPLFALPTAPMKAAALRKGSGVALAGSLSVDARRFEVSAEGLLIPADRLKPALGTTWHGTELGEAGLPVAFVRHTSAHTFGMARGKALKHDDEIERRSAVALSGKFRTVEGARYEETRDGEWLKSDDLTVIVKRHKLPDFAKGQQKWIDISIAYQTLTAYEGTKPIFATLVSTGRDQLKDPAQSASTARGNFHVQSKHVTRTRDPREVQNAFDITDAPWVMEFEPSFALTGAYWADPAGEPQSYHDVLLSPIDAHRLWSWSDPPLPEGWHSVFGSPDEGTIISIRP